MSNILLRTSLISSRAWLCCRPPLLSLCLPTVSQPRLELAPRRCAGCMVAAANGVGIVGVAPEAQVVAVRVATDDGYFFPAATVCAFMHAASVGIDVTSNRHVPPRCEAFISAQLCAAPTATPEHIVFWRFAGSQSTRPRQCAGRNVDSLMHVLQGCCSTRRSLPCTESLPCQVQICRGHSMRAGSNAGRWLPLHAVQRAACRYQMFLSW